MSVNSLKRYSLVLPEDLFNEVERLADERQDTVIELLRRFIKLGLLVVQIENSPDKTLLIREGDRDRGLLILA